MASFQRVCLVAADSPVGQPLAGVSVFCRHTVHDSLIRYLHDGNFLGCPATTKAKRHDGQPAYTAGFGDIASKQTR